MKAKKNRVNPVNPVTTSFRSWVILCPVILSLVTLSAPGQIQQAWAAHYNNGFTNGTNQAVKMVLDASGNIYVTGFSQNANTNLGYVTIKYAPNGNQLWATRYDSTNPPSASPSGLVLDNSNNVIVTGSAVTVKYDLNGNQLWTAPFPGAALASDTNGNAYVTGFGTNFNTVKLNPTGSNIWVATYSDVGPTVGQGIAVDGEGDVYVAGSDAWVYFFNNYSWQYYFQLVTVKFDPNGNQLWAAGPYNAPNSDPSGVTVGGVGLDWSNSFYLVASVYMEGAYLTLKYSSTGESTWTGALTVSASSTAHGLALDQNGGVYLTGQIPYALTVEGYNYYYGTFKLNANGTPAWTNHYPRPPIGSSVASGIVVDSANNSYVTGYSPGTNSGNDIVTIKYDQNGKQVWLQRYTSTGSGNTAGNAIAVDKNGNVYVTGYDTTTAGGTEIVTIKYSPVRLQRRSDGTVILQGQGTPGESFDIQASADLLNWLDLGSVLADTNGLMQFDDTNAPAYPARFYYTSPQ